MMFVIRAARWLRHPTLLRPRRDHDYVGVFLDNAAAITVGPITTVCNTVTGRPAGMPASHVFLSWPDGWTLQINGDAHGLRELAAALIDRADRCDAVGAIIRAGGTVTNEDLDAPEGWCPSHGPDAREVCPGCNPRGDAGHRAPTPDPCQEHPDTWRVDCDACTAEAMTRAETFGPAACDAPDLPEPNVLINTDPAGETP